MLNSQFATFFCAKESEDDKWRRAQWTEFFENTWEGNESNQIAIDFLIFAEASSYVQNLKFLNKSQFATIFCVKESEDDKLRRAQWTREWKTVKLKSCRFAHSTADFFFYI